ncbi:FG-GAP-like repeat-containing protein [Shewanella atlantica]|uniref:FG-GAP repeat domain-containing protein n=1 Tax=Shewanella atlantica TaxID=271099 RepID=UPI003736CF5E
MLIYCRFALVFISFILLGCSGSDDNAEEKNLPPVIELQAPSSALSLEQLTISAQVTDPENETVSLLWQLSSDAGVNMEVVDVNELSYQIPLTSSDTAYTVTLVATDSHGNQATQSSSFTVPALDVSFTLPFEAISQRYVDTEANLLNIASTDIDYSWKISQGSDYPLTSIAPNRVRFFAAKPLTKQYEVDESKGPEYIRGEGITEDLVLTLTIAADSDTMSFDKAIIVKPFENVPVWPKHLVSQETASSTTSVSYSKRNYVEAVDNCLSREYTAKKYFDYNQDGIDDVFCTYGDTLYFYLSDTDSAGEPVYSEFVIIDNQYDTGRAELIDLNKNGVPELVFAINIPGAFEHDPSKANTIVSLSYDESSQEFIQSTLFTLPEFFYSYRLVEESGVLSMAYLVSGARYETPKVAIFNIEETGLEQINSFVFNECIVCSIASLVSSDINGQPTDNELLLVINECFGCIDYYLGAPSKQRLVVIKDNYTSSAVFPEDFYAIFQEDINGDSILEWVGQTAFPLGWYDISLPEFKLRLWLDQDGEPKTELLENYYKDLFFYYRESIVKIDVNQDNQLDDFYKYQDYDSYAAATGSDLYFYSYRLANSEQRVLVTSQQLGFFEFDWESVLGLEDMNGDGHLDIKFGEKGNGDEVDRVNYWLENVEGYPFE